MRQRANICRTVYWTPHDSLFVQIREILEQKLDRTIWDGMILEMIDELTNFTEVQPKDDTFSMLDLPWPKSVHWSSIPSD